MRLIKIWPIVCLAALSGCMAGDFCDVVKGPIQFAPVTAAQIVSTDRRSAEAIDTQNRYGAGHCPGWK